MEKHKHKWALVSVSDKTGIVSFCQKLEQLGIGIISTGGTKTLLESHGIETVAVDAITGFEEMMNGRVKTLHPIIHGGLLGKRENEAHLEAMKRHDIPFIDLVCVNLYPFKETILKEGVTEEEAIENIDIGGPSMIRSGSKNSESVTVLVDQRDYETVIDELTEHGETKKETRKQLAAKAFRHTAAYDALIADYLTQSVGESHHDTLTLSYEKKADLRYGENNHQTAAFFTSPFSEEYSIGASKQRHGKELSFNNIRDADAALRLLREFKEPTAVALKHMNPCGIGVGSTLLSAYQSAYESDPVSIFGGIVAVNREVDEDVAEEMSHTFLELIIAPRFTETALAILTKKKNIRLLELPMDKTTTTDKKEIVSVLGGILVQELDDCEEDLSQWQVVTKRQPTEEEMAALIFAWSSVKHVKSNAIVLANGARIIGVGAGQMNRVGAVSIALKQGEGQLEGAVLGSDAFFPMADSIDLAGKQGIKAIIQPGGSIRDQESIDMANRYGMTMIMTGTRHFKH